MARWTDERAYATEWDRMVRRMKRRAAVFVVRQWVREHAYPLAWVGIAAVWFSVWYAVLRLVMP